ncbi:hypothetical protein ACXR0O_23595 [Verrucomicrobiota bacterium sgz303538]
MNTSVHVLTFTPDGAGHGLYTEVIELTAIGLLSIERATSIEFNEQTQEWEVKGTSGDLLYSDASRANCLTWEHRHFNQSPEEPSL